MKCGPQLINDGIHAAVRQRISFLFVQTNRVTRLLQGIKTQTLLTDHLLGFLPPTQLVPVPQLILNGPPPTLDLQSICSHPVSTFGALGLPAQRYVYTQYNNRAIHLKLYQHIASISGTSMATPHVAGLIAYFIGRHGNISPAAMSSLLKSFAVRGVLTGIRKLYNF